MNNTISVRAIIEYEGKFLLVRNNASADFWCLPGGGMEPGENILSALERELIEETHVKPEISNLIYIHQIREKNGYSNPGLYFHIKNSKDYLNHNVAASTHGGHELAEIDWVDVTKVTVLPRFLASELPDIARNGFNVNTRIRLE
ncbi:MAG: NUDIX hydrolase [Patescibacteria group bacterium]|nr:NUDIX hydrolase [Patescibacteria group bacterium]